MKIEFRFNGDNQLFLIPETSKDTQLLNIFIGGSKTFKLSPSTGDMAIITATTDASQAVSIPVGRPDQSVQALSYPQSS
jgi:hypothetical protein